MNTALSYATSESAPVQAYFTAYLTAPTAFDLRPVVKLELAVYSAILNQKSEPQFLYMPEIDIYSIEANIKLIFKQTKINLTFITIMIYFKYECIYKSFIRHIRKISAWK